MISRRMLRIKVIKTLYAHLKSDADSLMASQKTLVNSIDKTYDLYVLTLSLVAELAHYAEQRQELAKKKQLPTYEDLNPNRKFVDNRVVQLIANSDSVNDYQASRKLSWAAYPELIKTLYTQLE
ncbi:MAG: transcription termination factor, partial [Alistipes sp.]|nr:transcription termination factor [Alistipes sp.]